MSNRATEDTAMLLEDGNGASSFPPPKTSLRTKLCIIGGVLFVLLVLIAIIVTIVIVATGQKSLYRHVNVEDIVEHLEAFQRIAENPYYSGSRAVLTGYNASALYVIEELRKNGAADYCDVTTQHFKAAVATEKTSPTLSMVSPVPIEYQHMVDFRGLRYGGNFTGTVTGEVDFPLNYGCNASDYSGNTGDKIVLLEFAPTSLCSLIEQAKQAEDAGASAIIFHNGESRTSLSNSRVRGAGWFPGDPLITVPCLSATNSLGKTMRSLNASGNVIELEMVIDVSIVITDTYNVFCTLKEGKVEDTVVLGAHLDSVPAGPGINDNGSGSASVLQMAIEWFRRGKDPKNRIIFAWWGAEEIGLLGSRHFVRELQTSGDLDHIACNLNVDMLASPNYIIQIHDGNTSRDAPGALPGSLKIKDLYIDYFEQNNIEYGFTGMLGGSDYLPFVQAGISAGGLATGAGSLKTMEQRKQYGGLADAPFDPCYHAACDDILNPDHNALRDCADATAFVLDKLSEEENLREFLSE